MRFGLCLNMVAGDPQRTGIDKIEKLRPIGFDYAELPLAEMAALSEDAFDGLVKRVADSGVRCEVCNNFFPPTLRLTGQNAERERVLPYIEHALDRANRLGVEVVVFGSGGAKNVPEGFPLEQGFGQVVELLKDVAAPAARARGIAIAIEPLRKAECNLINTFQEGCALARAVNESNVRVLVDYYHMSEEREPLKNLLTDGREFLRHVHFANPNGRVYPRDVGESDYAAFAGVLKAVGYDGRVSCEAYAAEFDREAERALRLFRALFD